MSRSGASSGGQPSQEPASGQEQPPAGEQDLGLALQELLATSMQELVAQALSPGLQALANNCEVPLDRPEPELQRPNSALRACRRRRSWHSRARLLRRQRAQRCRLRLSAWLASYRHSRTALHKSASLCHSLASSEIVAHKRGQPGLI